MPDDQLPAVQKELVPTCRELGIGMLAYSPMGRGILTGSFKPEDLPADDMRRKLPGTYYASENLEAVSSLGRGNDCWAAPELVCVSM